jgi:hypothetical protein
MVLIQWYSDAIEVLWNSDAIEVIPGTVMVLKQYLVL